MTSTNWIVVDRFRGARTPVVHRTEKRASLKSDAPTTLTFMPALFPRNEAGTPRTALIATLVSVGLLATALAAPGGLTELVTPGPAHAYGAPNGANGAALPAERVPDRTTEAPRFSWPLSGEPDVVRLFHRPSSTYGPGHRGVDLAATPGQDVLASAEGVVIFAGRVAGRGVVSIRHNDGLRTTYEPVRWSVSPGQRVRRGQVIGTVAPGHDGCPVEACLHWGVRRDGTANTDYLDPLRLVLPAAPLRLKPWEGVVAHS
jgi:murein DD-endopeptidase MepM/ murein hydrolase activator NlpD